MSENKNRDLLPFLVILESVEKILVYAKGFQTAESFLRSDDQMQFNATLLLLSNIGEYITRISEETRSAYSTFPWKKIRGLRNRIAHDYTGIDYEMVFRIVRNDLPPLKNNIEIILKENVEKGAFDKQECVIARSSTFYNHIDFDQFI